MWGSLPRWFHFATFFKSDIVSGGFNMKTAGYRIHLCNFGKWTLRIYLCNVLVPWQPLRNCAKFDLEQYTRYRASIFCTCSSTAAAPELPGFCRSSVTAEPMSPFSKTITIYAIYGIVCIIIGAWIDRCYFNHPIEFHITPLALTALFFAQIAALRIFTNSMRGNDPINFRYSLNDFKWNIHLGYQHPPVPRGPNRPRIHAEIILACQGRQKNVVMLWSV